MFNLSSSTTEFESKKVISQALISLAKESSSNNETATYLNGKIDDLAKALETNPDIYERIKDVLTEKKDEKTEDHSMRWRQLRDATFFLRILDKELQKSEALKKDFSQNFHALVQKVNEVVRVTEPTVIPPWQSLLEALDNEIQLKDPRYKNGRAEAVNLAEYRFPSKITTKGFAHMHGEVFIANSGLEGETQGNMMKYLTAYLENSNLSENGKKLLRTLKSSEEFFEKFPFDEMCDAGKVLAVRDSFCGLVNAKFKNLAAGEKLLMPTGWVSTSGGHAMYLEAMKQDNGKFTVRIFNSGAGLENHPKILLDNTYKSHPFLEIKNIEESRLGGKDFLSALLEINLCTQDTSKTPTRYSQEDLYNILWPYLGGEKVDRAWKIDEFITPQPSGTCTWSSLMALAQSYLSPDEFSRMQYEIRLVSLCDFYNQRKENLQQNEEERMLFQKGAEQFCRELLACYKSKVITLDELIKGKDAMQVILRSLNQAKNQAEYEESNQRVVDFRGIEAIPVKTGSMPYLETQQVNMEANMDSASAPVMPYKDFSWATDPVRIDEEMEKFRIYCQECLTIRDHKRVLDISIDNFFAHLPNASAGDDFWKGLPKDKMVKCMHEIAMITDAMYAFYSPGEKMNPQHLMAQAHALKGMAVLHRLGVLSGELAPLLNGYKLPIKNILKDTFGTEFHGRPLWDANLYDAKSRADLKTTFDYLEEVCREDRYIDNDAFIVNDSYTTALALIDFTLTEDELNKSSPREVKFICGLLENKDFKEKFINKYPELKDKPLLQQVAKCLTDLQGDIMPQSFCDLKRVALLSKAINLRLSGWSTQHQGLLQIPSLIDASNRLIIKMGTKSEGQKQLPSFGDIEDKSLNYLIYISRIKRETGGREAYFSEAEIQNIERLDQFQISSDDPPIQIPLDETKDLLCLMTGADYDSDKPHLEMQPEKTLSYFAEHLAKLNNPDYQAFLRLILFESANLETLLRLNPSMADIMADFVKHGYESFLENGDVATAAFFIELGRTMEGIVLQAGIKQTGSAFPEPIETIGKLLKISSLTPDERTLLLKHLAASFLQYKKSPLSQDDVKTLLSAMANVKAHPEFKLRHSSQLDNEIDQVLIKYSEDIARSIQGPEGSKILKGIAEELGIKGTSAELWETKSHYPFCRTQDGVLSFNLMDGCFYHREQLISVLPKTIKENETFKAVFPRDDYLVRKIDDAYEFEDDEKIPTRIIVKARETVIYKELVKGEWFQHIPEQKLPSALKEAEQNPLGSPLLVHGMTHWQSMNEAGIQKTLIMDKDRKIRHEVLLKPMESATASGIKLTDINRDFVTRLLEHKPQNDFEKAARSKLLMLMPSDLLVFGYLKDKEEILNKRKSRAEDFWRKQKMQVSPDKLNPWQKQALEVIDLFETRSFIIQAIEKITDDGRKLKLIDNNGKDNPFNFIKSFAGGNFYTAWKNDKGEPELLEVPKLNLQFNLVKEGNRWEAQCIQMPGFKISANQKIKGLPGLAHGLVLENIKGERKVLIPRLAIEPKGKGALSTKIDLQRSYQNQPENYLVFELDAKKGIHSSSREQQLFLAYLYLGKKDYQSAYEMHPQFLFLSPAVYEK